MCWGIATACAREIASSNKQDSLCNEQNCFGTISPASVVVIARNLVPSPAARTTAHVFETLRIVKPPLSTYPSLSPVGRTNALPLRLPLTPTSAIDVAGGEARITGCQLHVN